MKKKLFVGLLLIFACKNLIAQNPVPEFQLPLYCSDALNNKDTVYVGYDTKAKYGFSDGDFGEEDIRNEPFVKEFDVRVGSYRPQQWTLPYLSKKFVERRSCTTSTPIQSKGVNVSVNLYTRIKHFPLKIAWDSLLIDKICNYNSFMHRSPLSEVNGKYKVEDRIYLRHKKEIVISKEWMRDSKKSYQNLFATQDIIIENGDTLYGMLFFLLDKNKDYMGSTSWISTSDTKDNLGDNIMVSPNPTSNTLNFEYIGDKTIEKIAIYSNGGSLLKFEKFITSESTKYQSYINDLQDGMYYLRLYFDDGTSSIKRFVKLE